jgi:C4-dicarboxylate transporter
MFVADLMNLVIPKDPGSCVTLFILLVPQLTRLGVLSSVPVVRLYFHCRG